MIKFKLAYRLLALLSLLPISGRADSLALPDSSPQETTGSTNLPEVSPKVGPLNLGLQFIKRPSTNDQKSIKDLGFGMKFSIAI
jgi:hypothetical protein